MKKVLKSVLFISCLLVAVITTQACLGELITGIHEIKIVNKTNFDLKDIEIVSVFQDGKSKVSFSEVKANKESDFSKINDVLALVYNYLLLLESDFSKINDVLAGSYQVGFKASSSSSSENYKKDDVVSSPLIKIEAEGGKYEHTLTFSGSSLKDITYKLTTSKK